jgi:hypothetical protein
VDRTVTLTQLGREGQVIYREGERTITGYQQFGGDDVVAILSLGSVDQWRIHHTWAMNRRAQILRDVADEVIRQQAPSCSADIDEAAGDIVLRNSAIGLTGASMRPATVPPSAARTDTSPDVSWVHRYRELRFKVGLIVLALALVFAGMMWVKTRVLVVQPGKGVPIGSTARNETHLATLISQLQPYTPSLHRDGSTDRFTLSLFIVPLDSSPPQTVRLVRDLPPGSYALARVIGSDGGTMWIDINGLYGVDLRTHAIVTEADVVKANPELDPNMLSHTRGMDIVNGRLQMMTHDRSGAWTLEPATLKAVPSHLITYSAHCRIRP